jgi:hypothetical protein
LDKEVESILARWKKWADRRQEIRENPGSATAPEVKQLFAESEDLWASMKPSSFLENNSVDGLDSLARYCAENAERVSKIQAGVEDGSIRSLSEVKEQLWSVHNCLKSSQERLARIVQEIKESVGK